MTKQEFLAMSIFTGLKYLDDNKKMVDLHCIDNGIGLVNFGWGDAKNIDEVFPIARPLSYLTKPIEHKGEKFVPMVELAKMIIDLPDYAPYCFTTKTSTFLQSDKHEFGYNHQGQSFHLFERELMEHKSFPNQLGLFLKLIEWHFDIADLISKGEAIDVNTLPENPYK